MKHRYCDDIRFRVSPLHHVMARCSTEEVLRTLDHRLCNVNVIDSAKQTPLYYAIYRGFRTGVNLLLDRGARLDIQDEDGNSPLHFAVKWGYKDVVHDLLKRNADMEAKNKYGQTVLHYAIVWNYRKSFEAIVDLLLRNGANVNAKDKDGETPLHCAAARRDSRTVCKMLFSSGAKVGEKEKKGNTPLHIATLRVCKDAIDTLIDNGADLEQKNFQGDTPLHCAVKSKVLESVEFLLTKGANVNVVNDDGESPLHIASRESKKDVIEILLNNGANIDAENVNGESPLHLAVRESNEDIIKVLLLNGADIQLQDAEGNTALHVAASTHRGDCVDLLIDNGANVKARNDYGETPSYLALQESYQEDKIDNLLVWETSFLGNNFEFYSMLNLHFKYSNAQVRLIMHIVKLKCAKINITNECYAVLNNVPNVKCYESMCCDEVEKIKAKKFGRNTLYEVFSNYADPLFLSNTQVEKEISSARFERDFPIYDSLLKVTLKKCKKRLFLLNDAHTRLQDLWPADEVPLPSEILRKILSYLDEDDLDTVIVACKDELL